MITRQDIDKLAALSRLKLSEEETLRMEGEMASILAYVDKLKGAASTESGPVMSANISVMREDVAVRKGGEYTNKLLDLAPKSAESEGHRYVKVKKILGSSQ